MAKTDIPLSDKLRKLRIAEGYSPFLFDALDSATGLPESIGPFWIDANRDRDMNKTGLFDVKAATARGQEFVVLAGFLTKFEAVRAMVDCQEAWLPMRPIERVYFIGTSLKRGALIKVGFSRDPEVRLRDLQTGQGERLQIFATIPGSRALEGKYHRRWKHRRMTGEWFVIGDCILAEIERLNSLPTPLAGRLA